MWLEWKHTFLTIANKYAPLRTKRVRKQDILKKKSDRVKCFQWLDENKRQRNVANREIRLAKQACYHQRFTEHTGDSQRTWQTISELTSRKPRETSVTSLKVNGLTITNSAEISDEFNDHFLISIQPMQTKCFHLSAFNSLLLYFSLDKSYLYQSKSTYF